MSRQTLTRAAKVLFGTFLLVWLLYQVDFDRLSELSGDGDPLDLVASVASFLVALVGFQALRLHVLVRGYTDSLLVSYKLFAVGAFFNNLLPSNVGGDAVRLMYLRKMKGDDWGGPLAMLVLHRVSGLVILLIAGAVYALFEHDRLAAVFASNQLGLRAKWGGPLLIVCTVGAVFAGFVLWRFGPRLGFDVRGPLRNGRNAIARLTAGDITWLCVLTLAFHFFRLLCLYFGVAYFGQEIPMIDIIPALVVTAVVALLPISVGGLGLMEGSTSLMLSIFGVAPSVAIVVALLVRVVMLAVAAVGGVLYTLDKSSLGAGGE